MRKINTILQEALIECGAYERQDYFDEWAVKEALDRLNLILDELPSNNILIPTQTVFTFPVIGGKQSYTVSSIIPADVMVPYIIEVNTARLLYGEGQNQISYILQVLQVERIDRNVDYPKTGGIPTYATYENYNQYGVFKFYPSPQQNYTAEIRGKTALANVALNDDASVLPPTYHLYLIKKLTKELCALYKSPVPEMLQMDIQEKEKFLQAQSKSDNSVLPTSDLASLNYNGYNGWGYNRGGNF